MKLNEFYNEVSRHADTEGTRIGVAETKRVLAVMFDELCKLNACEAADLIAKGLAAAEKRKG